jgi:hypothetical protein
MSSAHPLFVVIRRYGPPYDSEKPLEAQPEWEAHRVFMNDLEAKGIARLGEPVTQNQRPIRLSIGAREISARHLPFSIRNKRARQCNGRKTEGEQLTQTTPTPLKT